jgi:hypothetical protein
MRKPNLKRGVGPNQKHNEKKNELEKKGLGAR